MLDYTLTLTREEFDELERCVRRQYRDSTVELLCGDRAAKARLREISAVQGRIAGKLLDTRRRAGEIKPRRDPENPLLPAGESD